jgi:hypothetical protein
MFFHGYPAQVRRDVARGTPKLSKQNQHGDPRSYEKAIGNHGKIHGKYKILLSERAVYVYSLYQIAKMEMSLGEF